MGSIPDVQGYHHIRTAVVPGPGGYFTIAPIAGTRMRIVALRFRFVTAAVGGVRYVHLQIRDATRIAATLLSTYGQLLGATRYYSYVAGFSGALVIAGSEIMQPWTGLFVMDQEYYLQSDVENAQAFDQLSEIVYATEEWISE